MVGYLEVFGYLKFLETSSESERAWAASWPSIKLMNMTGFKGTQSALVNASQQSQGGFMNTFLGGVNSSQTATQARGVTQPAQPNT